MGKFKIAINQPAYLPWPGYLDRIANVDLFVVMDDVQFERGSLVNRNKIRDQHGWRWLTVPVKLKGHTASTISETRIDSTRLWAANHMKQIHHAYRRAPRFFENFKLLEQLYSHDTGTIGELCIFHLLGLWLPQYGIETPVQRMPRGLRHLHKTDLVPAICKHFGADEYLSGRLGADYMDMAKMDAAGISVSFDSWQPTPYPQIHGDFIPGLSILDYWMMEDRNPWESQSSSFLRTPMMKPSAVEEPSQLTLREETGYTS
jgi:hypothetical protein